MPTKAHARTRTILQDFRAQKQIGVVYLCALADVTVEATVGRFFFFRPMGRRYRWRSRVRLLTHNAKSTTVVLLSKQTARKFSQATD